MAVATSAAAHAVLLGGLAALARIGPAPTLSRDHRPLTFVTMVSRVVPHDSTPSLAMPAPVVERVGPERRTPVEVAAVETPPPALKPVAQSDPLPAPQEPPRPAPAVGAPPPSPVRVPPPVTVGLFTDSAPAVHEAQPVTTIRDAGFDAPAAAPGKTASSGAAVASAGFGANRADNTVTTRRVAEVQSAGFDAVTLAPAQARRATPAPDRIDIPVEIVFKPAPIYPEEARQLKLEGDVLLDVEFTATGVVSVLQVVRGLGHGLDEAAVAAAKQIRFKPALSAGRPIGFRTTVHIVFRLA
jgi:TonB family protein